MNYCITFVSTKQKTMRNRLPLPLSTIKEIKSLITESGTNWDIVNLLRNTLINICEYEYNDAIRLISYLKQDYPSLMDYEKHIKAIDNAHKRYDAI